jgi:hypothetical protein
MKVEIESVFTHIQNLRPSSVAIVTRSLRSWEEWEDGEKVIRFKLEDGADRFASALVGISHVPILASEINERIEEISECEMCVVAGEPYYGLLMIGKTVMNAGYKGHLFLEISNDEAQQEQKAGIAARNAERIGATSLLANFVYLTKKRGQTKSINFPLSTATAESTIAPVTKPLIEGKVRSVVLTKVERSSEARRKCIDAHGACCSLCGFDFSATFGKEGEGLIHVHHLNQICESEGEREVDPVTDLVPVCPNCHFFIHSRKPMYSLEEVRGKLEGRVATRSLSPFA